METVRKSTKTRVLTRVLATAAAVAASATIAASPASATVTATDPVQPAGISRCLGIWAQSGYVKLQHISSCGPTGYYHIRIWSPGRSVNGSTYWYSGALREFRANWPVPGGTNICAELWYHEGGGRYSSWGLPCDTM